MSFDVTRTAALFLSGALCIVGAIVLWALEKDGAGTVFALGEAILIGGFGIAIGEKGGAQAAQNALDEGPA